MKIFGLAYLVNVWAHQTCIVCRLDVWACGLMYVDLCMWTCDVYM
jgi:hypothetical protein